MSSDTPLIHLFFIEKTIGESDDTDEGEVRVSVRVRVKVRVRVRLGVGVRVRVTEPSRMGAVVAAGSRAIVKF